MLSTRLTPRRRGVSTNSTAQARIGWFENLELFVGIVFDRRDNTVIDYMCSQQDGAFEWRPHVHSALERCPWHQQDMPNKKMNMVAYLLELFYDLCLSPANNISESPGFKLPMNIHGSAKLD